MIDIILALAGVALSVGAGWVMGRFSRMSSTVAPARLICSCDHGYGSHHEGNKCAAQTKRPFYYSNGGRNGYKWVPCPCLTYDGPEPLPRVWTREMG